MIRNITIGDTEFTVDNSIEIKHEFPQIVVEELTTGDFHLWQIDNPNDIDQKNQMVIISEHKLNKITK